MAQITTQKTLKFDHVLFATWSVVGNTGHGDHPFFRAGSRVEQSLAEIVGNDSVVRSMALENWSLVVADDGQGVKPVVEQTPYWKPTVMINGHVSQTGKGPFQD